MAKYLRWVGYLVGGLLLLALLAAATVWIVSEQKLNARSEPRAASLAKPTPAQLADGPRQLYVLGCLSCHGKGLQGDIFMDEPKIAKIYAPNLTLIAAKASDQQLEQGIRQGIGHDGRTLLIMPSEGYQFLTDEEVAALIAAIRAMPKGGQVKPAASIGPVGRLGLTTGRFRTAPTLVSAFAASRIADLGPQFAAGKHIAEVNCAECHGPDLKGMELTPGTVSADLTIAGSYDLEQFKALLRDGVAPGKKDIGMMGDVARSDFKYLKDDEIAAIHAYLTERARRMP